MSDPLKNITRRLRWLDRLKISHQRTEFVQYDSIERTRLLRIEERQRQDALVQAALEKFRDLAYPKMIVRTYDEAWSLGRWDKHKVDDGSRAWFPVVDVFLRYDKWNRALHLECSGHNRRLRVALDPIALSKALVQIHAPPKNKER